MNFFDEATLRLKQQLKVTEDKAVASALGMSARAWSGRKERSSFPDKELLALIAKRPDLGLDYDYITTGISSQQFEAAIRAAERKPLTGPDERLAGIFAVLSPASRKEVLSIALRLRELEAELGASQSVGAATQNFHGPVSGGVAGRDIVKKGGK